MQLIKRITRYCTTVPPTDPLLAPLPMKERLLLTSLSYVPIYGWSDRAILMACSALDLSPAAHRLISPYDMITHSMRNWNSLSLRELDDNNFEHATCIRDKIALSIQVRLMKQLPFIDTWGQAMFLGAKPENITTTHSLLWSYSDEVWRRCGDVSTDYNFYTKRTLFNTTYAATELYLLTDQSPDKFATWQFLSRRMDDVEIMGRSINDAKVVASAVGDGLLSLLNSLKSPKDKSVQ